MCGVSECDREASTMSRPWPIVGACVMGKNYSNYEYLRRKLCFESKQFLPVTEISCIIKTKAYYIIKVS